MFLARKSLSCSQIWQWVLPQGGIHMFHGNVWLLCKLQARISVNKYHRSWFTPSEVWVRPGRATKLSSILQPHCADGEPEAQQLHVLPAELTAGSKPLQSNPALWESPFFSPEMVKKKWTLFLNQAAIHFPDNSRHESKMNCCSPSLYVLSKS